MPVKQFVALEDLAGLSESQKRNLRELWDPAQYDLAVYFACTDAENDCYEPLPFVVGDVRVQPMNEDKRFSIVSHPSRAYQYHRLILCPLYLMDEIAADANPDTAEPASGALLPPEVEKQDCLPLLGIGQMVGLLREKAFDGTEFFVRFSPEDGGYSIGRKNWTYDQPEAEYQAAELCDALWEGVKGLL